MIRQPRKNIAQRAIEKQNQLPVPKPDPKNDPASPSQEDFKPSIPKEVDYLSELKPEHIKCRGKYGGRLYPEKLWQLHHDIETIFYNPDNLPEKDLEEVRERMPHSLSGAEKAADKLLSDFVQDSIDSIGIDPYLMILKKAMGEQAKKLYALRCFIASNTDLIEPNQITIHSNKTMNSSDFFPKECKRTMVDPKTKEEMVYYVDQPDEEDDAYWRSSNHRSQKHKIVAKLLESISNSELNKLPKDFGLASQAILKNYGIEVDSLDGAWKILSELGKQSSIEDKILARISYLITNAQIKRKKFYLD